MIITDKQMKIIDSVSRMSKQLRIEPHIYGLDEHYHMIALPKMYLETDTSIVVKELHKHLHRAKKEGINIFKWDIATGYEDIEYDDGTIETHAYKFLKIGDDDNCVYVGASERYPHRKLQWDARHEEMFDKNKIDYRIHLSKKQIKDIKAFYRKIRNGKIEMLVQGINVWIRVCNGVESRQFDLGFTNDPNAFSFEIDANKFMLIMPDDYNKVEVSTGCKKQAVLRLNSNDMKYIIDTRVKETFKRW